MEKTVLVEKVAPAIIFLALWLNGSVYPLLLLPFLYVIFVEKRGIRFLGFQKNGASKSLYLGTMVSVFLIITHCFVFRHYFPLIGRLTPNLYDIFTDVFWYPLYEEIAYRSFFLNHFADLNPPSVHRKKSRGQPCSVHILRFDTQTSRSVRRAPRPRRGFPPSISQRVHFQQNKKYLWLSAFPLCR